MQEKGLKFQKTGVSCGMTYVNPVNPGIFVLNIPSIASQNIKKVDELKNELEGTPGPSNSNADNTAPDSQMQVMQFMLGAQGKALQNLQHQTAVLKKQYAQAQTPQDKARIEGNMFRLNQAYQNKELQYTSLQSAIGEMGANTNAQPAQSDKNAAGGI